MKRIATIVVPLVLVISLPILSDTVSAQQRNRRMPDVWKFLAEKYDANDDGKLSKDEYDRSEEVFNRFDTNNDGVLSSEDWAKGGTNRSRRNLRDRAGADAPAVGQNAPDFTLTMVDKKTQEVHLSDLAGEKPVALIFGSCT